MNKSIPDTTKYPKLLPRLLCILCILQPVLDALSYWQAELGLFGVSVLRTVMLVLIAAVGFAVSEKKRIYVIAFAAFALFWTAHILSCLQNGYAGWQEDLANYVRVLQLPVTLLAVISCLRRQADCREALFSGLFYAFCMIVLLQILALVTGTEPYTYSNKQLGLRGWCFWPNSQSTILSLLAPMVCLYALRQWKDPFWLAAAVCVLALAYLWLHGTRLAYLCLFMTAAGLVLTVLILKLPKKYLLLFLGCCLVFACLFPVSPMVRNQQKVADNAERKQEILTSLVKAGEEQAAAQYAPDSEEYRAARLSLAYEFYLPGLVERFGLQKTAEIYDYSEDAAVVANERTWKNNYCKLLMDSSETKLSRLFGLNVSDMKAAGQVHDSENDLQAMYYLYGYVGLAATIALIGYFLFIILKAMLKDPKQTFTLEAACLGISLLATLAHCYFTCGVLRRSNVLFYFGVILALIFHEIKGKGGEPTRI